MYRHSQNFNSDSGLESCQSEKYIYLSSSSFLALLCSGRSATEISRTRESFIAKKGTWEKCIKSTTVNKFKSDVFIHLFVVLFALLLFLSNCGCMTLEYTRYIKYFYSRHSLARSVLLCSKLFTIQRRMPTVIRSRDDEENEDIPLEIVTQLRSFPFSKAASSLFMNQCLQASFFQRRRVQRFQQGSIDKWTENQAKRI